MSAYSKRSLPVQFPPFGVEQHGIIVPILHRSRDAFAQVHEEGYVQVTSAPRQANVQVKNLRRPR